MTSMFQWTDDGPVLILNTRGESLPLTEGTNVSLDNFVGARVRVTREHSRVTFEAAVPGSSGLLRWRFDVVGHGLHSVDHTGPLPPVRNLAALISECQVGIHGGL